MSKKNVKPDEGTPGGLAITTSEAASGRNKSDDPSSEVLPYIPAEPLNFDNLDILAQVDLVNKFELQLMANLNKSLYGDVGNRLLGTAEAASLSKTILAISEGLKASLFRKKEIMAKDNVDFHHPKIQLAFRIIIKKFFDAVTEAGFTEEEKARISDIANAKFDGIEEQLTKDTQGFKGSLQDVTNTLAVSIKK
jgi:hypothetical protein